MAKPSNDENKLVIVMRKDLNMPVGKCIAQGGHAILGVVRFVEREGTEEQKSLLKEWESGSFTKITLAVNSEDELREIFENALSKGLATKWITDNGWTVFDGVKTSTCIGIFGKSKEIDKVTGILRLY